MDMGIEARTEGGVLTAAMEKSVPRAKRTPNYKKRNLPSRREQVNGRVNTDAAAITESQAVHLLRQIYMKWKASGQFLQVSEEDSKMLQTSHSFWLAHQHKLDKFLACTTEQPDPDYFSPADLIAGLQNLSRRNESLSNLLLQIDVLLKSAEPTRTHTEELLKAFLFYSQHGQNLDILKQKAEGGNVNHMVALAYLQDVDESLGALALYQTAAQMENSIAAMQLGSKYLRGDGVEKDSQLSYDWYLRAANMGNCIAQHKVAYFYDEGLDGICDIDIEKAIKWYSTASKVMPDSMHNLAKIYEDGRGDVAPNLSKAVSLYSVAAARGFALSQVNLGRLFLLGEVGVERDREAGKRLLTLAAESGDSDAQMVIGIIHATPAFECPDLAVSEYWLRRSVRSGKKDAAGTLLDRVKRQMADSGIFSLPDNIPKTSKSAAAAKLRGDDYLKHDLKHAAVLEYSRALELDKDNMCYFADKVCSLCALSNFDECFGDNRFVSCPFRTNSVIASGENGHCPTLEHERENLAWRRVYEAVGRGLVDSFCRGNPTRDIPSRVHHQHVEGILDVLLQILLQFPQPVEMVTTQHQRTKNIQIKIPAFLAHVCLKSKRWSEVFLRRGGVVAVMSVLDAYEHEDLFLSDCIGILVNLMQHVRVQNLVVACDGPEILSSISCQSKRSAAATALQLLGNMCTTLNSGYSTWSEEVRRLFARSFALALSAELNTVGQWRRTAVRLSCSRRHHNPGLPCPNNTNTNEMRMQQCYGRISQAMESLRRALYRAPPNLVLEFVHADVARPLQYIYGSEFVPKTLRTCAAVLLFRLLTTADSAAIQRTQAYSHLSTDELRKLLSGAGIFESNKSGKDDALQSKLSVYVSSMSEALCSNSDSLTMTYGTVLQAAARSRDRAWIVRGLRRNSHAKSLDATVRGVECSPVCGCGTDDLLSVYYTSTFGKGLK